MIYIYIHSVLRNTVLSMSVQIHWICAYGHRSRLMRSDSLEELVLTNNRLEDLLRHSGHSSFSSYPSNYIQLPDWYSSLGCIPIREPRVPVSQCVFSPAVRPAARSCQCQSALCQSWPAAQTCGSLLNALSIEMFEMIEYIFEIL